MVTRAYVPSRGDVVWVTLSGMHGHEQNGRRPMIIISPYEYNQKIGLALACPITSKSKGYPHEVSVLAHRVSGVVLSDQVRSIDWRARKAAFIEKVDNNTTVEILGKLDTLIS